MTNETHKYRVQPIETEDAPDELRPLFDKADSVMVDGNMPGPTLFGNQVRALAHNPPLLQALTQVYQAFGETQTVDRKLVELGVLIVSRINACAYCVQHHAPLAHDAGLTTAQLRAIQDDTWHEQRDLWSDVEWLVIQYAAQLTRAPHKISDAFFAALHAVFTDREIVDLTMRWALTSAWNKFNDALQLDTESAVQHAFAELRQN
ncbi:MAG: carboxymuconolactone decarboxylase family protein [Chloroflexi bacterium]|nr:MAG: carboxymuconolactone decarboxylase family protein [Chloroflexota bacterium]